MKLDSTKIFIIILMNLILVHPVVIYYVYDYVNIIALLIGIMIGLLPEKRYEERGVQVESIKVEKVIKIE